MSQDTRKQSVLFEGLSKKAVIAKFDQDHASSAGGAFLLKAAAQHEPLTEKVRALETRIRELQNFVGDLRAMEAEAEAGAEKARRGIRGPGAGFAELVVVGGAAVCRRQRSVF